jgi:hypothetical protein
VPLVRQCLAPVFTLALTPCVLVGLQSGLFVAVLSQRTRNFMLCTVHYLGHDHQALDALCANVSQAVADAKFKVCKKGLDKFMTKHPQMPFRNYLHWEQPQWPYSREIPAGLFNRLTSQTIIKAM